MKILEKYITNKEILERFEKNFEKLLYFKFLVFKWNKKINLTSYNENEFFFHALIEPLIIFNALPPFKEILDIGTGFGNPSVTYSIIFPETNVFCSEINKKKLSFLNFLKFELNLTNFIITKTYKKNYQCITARAFKSFNSFLKFLKKENISGNYLLFFFKENNFKKKSVIKMVNYKFANKEYLQVLFNLKLLLED